LPAIPCSARRGSQKSACDPVQIRGERVEQRVKIFLGGAPAGRAVPTQSPVSRNQREQRIRGAPVKRTAGLFREKASLLPPAFANAVMAALLVADVALGGRANSRFQASAAQLGRKKKPRTGRPGQELTDDKLAANLSLCLMTGE
jgi:hypothetical protein